MDSTREFDVALDFLKSNSDVSSDVVQALRQAVDTFATTGRSQPASCQDARKFKPSSSKRQQLTAEEAAEIYKMRPVVEGKGKRPKRGSMIRCKAIAPKYGVSAKTIRDIWRGRTWIEATRHLWTSEEKHRRAVNGDENSDSEVEEDSGITRITSPGCSTSSLQGIVPHSSACWYNMPANCPAPQFGPASWPVQPLISSPSWPNQLSTFSLPNSSNSSSGCDVTVSQQLLQQKISMLEMALKALKAPAIAQPMFSSPYLGAPSTCPVVSAQNLMINQFVRNNFSSGNHASCFPSF
jgi:hypothetical protein